MATPDKTNSNGKLIVILVLLFIGINGLSTLVAEKAYQSIGDDSAYYFQLNWWVSTSFTLLVCAILSGFLAQFGSLSRCIVIFSLLLLSKAVFAGSTFIAFHFAGPYGESINQAASAAAFSSLPAAIIHIVFAFITILFIKPFSSSERHEDEDFNLEMPSFEMPKMDAARPRLHSSPDLDLAGQEKFPHPLSQDQQSESKTTTNFEPPLPPVREDETPPPPPMEPPTGHEEPSETSAKPLIQIPSTEPLLKSPAPEDDSAPTLLNPSDDEKSPTPALLDPSSSEPPSLTPLMDASTHEEPIKDIEITLDEIVDQIDVRNFNCPPEQLNEHGFNIDPSEIIPQLTEGKITISAEQALSKVSEDILRIPAAEIARKLPDGKIVLPLDKIIQHLPETTFSLSFPQKSALEVGDLPDPFEEREIVAEKTPGTKPIVHSIPGSAAPELQADFKKQQQQAKAEHEQPQATEPEQPSRLEHAKQDTGQTHETPVAQEQPLPADMPDSLEVNLAFIISRLPENSLAVTFSELQDKIETPGKLAIPTQIVAPQVQSGKVALTAGQIISMFPSGCLNKSEQDLARGLPEGGLELQLDDIVDQLPKQFFELMHKIEAANVDEMPEVFKDPGHAISPEEKSPILTDPDTPPPGTMEVFQRFMQDQEEKEQHQQQEQTEPEELNEQQPDEPTPIQQSHEDDLDHPEPVEPEQPAGQIAGLMNNVESTLPSTIEPSTPEPAGQPDSAEHPLDIEEITDQPQADAIINSINQTNLIFSAGMKLYQFQNTYITTLVRPGLETNRLVKPLPEVVSAMTRFTEDLQLGGLQRAAFVSQTGAIDIEFPESPTSGRWVLLADNKSQSLGILFNYFNAHSQDIEKIFDAPDAENPVFTPVPEINDSENKYHPAGNLTAGLSIDFSKKFALSRIGGYHWEVMQKQEPPMLDESPDSFELLEPVLRYTTNAGWGQSLLILLRTEQAVFALTQPTERDTMCLMLAYPAATSDGNVAYQAAKVRSLVEQSL